MQKLYISKVMNILGGLRGESELEIIKDCFSRNLSPDRAAQVVINNR